MLFASEESLFRSIEKRAKDTPGHVYRYHPIDLVILLAFVISVLLVLVGFSYFEIKYPMGGLFYHLAREEEANTTEFENTTAVPADVNVTDTSAAASAPAGATPNVLLQQMRGRFPKYGRSTRRSICSDVSCKLLSRYLKESLNPSVDPCSNFYEFVCSRWSLRDKLVPGEAVVTEDSLRVRDIEAFLIAQLKEGGLKRASNVPEDQPQDESLRWTKSAFAECKLGVKTTRKAFRNLVEHQGLEGFPYYKDPLKLAETAANVIRASGVSPIVKVSLDADTRDGKRVIRLSPSEDLLFRDFWTISNHHEKWYGAAVAKAASGISLPSVFNVEKKLTELSATSADTGGPMLLRLSDLNSFHKWNWKDFLRTLFNGVSNVTRFTYVRLESDTFVRGLASVLRSFRPRDIANFLGFRVHLKYSPILDKFRLLSMVHSSLHPGWNESLSRDMICLRFLVDVEPFMFMYLYWNTFKASLEPSIVENIVQNAKNTILNFVEPLSWLNLSFKNACEDRLHNMTSRYLIPKWLTDEDKRLKYTGTVADHVHYSGINTYSPVIQAVENNRLRAIDGTGFDVSWESHPLETEPVWAHEGVIEFPMAMFSREYEGDAFWLYNLPRAGVKVMISLVAALVEEAKVSERSVYSELLRSKSCLEAHYRTMRETQVPEHLTSTMALENEVVENMALPLTLLLYRSYVQPNNDIVLDGFKDYSSDQLFFINYALGRCEATDSLFAWQKLRFGKIPPAAYRVNGPLRNSEEFAEAFKCPSGSYMNPSKKCFVWTP